MFLKRVLNPQGLRGNRLAGILYSGEINSPVCYTLRRSTRQDMKLQGDIKKIE